MHNYGMYIIAIGWLYVTLLVAANEGSIVAGIISFTFYGLLPCGLLLWMSGTKVRRQRRAYLEAKATKATPSGQPDQAGHPASDAVAPIGKEAIPVVDRTHPAPEDRTDPR
jgi:hypothetical protein